MDLRDFRILRELHRDPFASNEAIGRAVGVSGTAVQARLSQLEKRGVLQGVYALMAADIFGRHRMIAAWAIPEPDKAPAPDRVLRVEDVVYIWRAPEVMSVNLFLKAPDAPVPLELSKLFGRPPVGLVRPDPPREKGPASAMLSPLDWRVLEALFEAPRASVADLARATGLTHRTVRKHRDALVEQDLVEIVPMLDTSREPGLIVYSGYVMVKSRGDLRKVTAPGLARVWTHYDPPAVAILGHVETFGEARAVEQRLRAIPGVVQVVFTIPQGGAIAADRVRGWIRAERERWSAARHRTTGQASSDGPAKRSGTQAASASRP